MTIDPNAFLMGGGGVPSARFDTPGDTITGTVEDLKVTQQTDFQTNEPKVWPNGDPMNQLVVTLANTGQFDPTREEEDGRRRVYVKGKSLTEAVRNAVRGVGAKGLDVGGRLTVQYVGDGVAERKGVNPPKLYAAAYEAPNPAAEFLGTQVQPQGGYTAPAQPVLPQVQAPNYGYLPATGAAPAVGVAQVPTVQQLIPAAAPAAVAVAEPPPAPGLTPEQAAAIAALSPAQRTALGL